MWTHHAGAGGLPFGHFGRAGHRLYVATEDSLVALEEKLETLCEEEKAPLSVQEDMADTVVFRFSDLLPVYVLPLERHRHSKLSPEENK